MLFYVIVSGGRHALFAVLIEDHTIGTTVDFILGGSIVVALTLRTGK